uniref:DUF1049 domain-containing protein n=1 Tax=Panagrolaimus sp. PS1159 TaxID=55785 RepID=A0AC35GQC2_9BILA
MSRFVKFVAFGILFILFGSEKTQLTKGIEISTPVQIIACIVGALLIFAGLYGFYIGMRQVFIRHKKHLKKLDEREQKRRPTNLNV